MKRFMVFVVCLLMFQDPHLSLALSYSRGTAIFAIRTPDEIAVAADSRVIGVHGLPSYTPVCKIRQLSNLFVAAYGLYEESQTGYNLWEIINQAGRGFNNVSTLADSLESYLRTPLEKALKHLRFADPGFYKEKCIQRSPLGVILGGIENDTLIIKHRKITVFDPASGNIWINFSREDCPGSGCADGYLVIAVSEDLENELSSQGKDTTSSGRKKVIDLANHYVARAISRNTIKYGPPIDLIYLNKDGLRWIQKKAECNSRD